MTHPPALSRRCLFELILLGTVFSAALALRLPGLTEGGFWPDEAKYAWYARQILQDPGNLFHPQINAFAPPLYALLLGPAQMVFPSDLACRVTALVFGLAGLMVIYLTGRRLAGPWAGLTAVVLAAAHPVYLLYSVKVLADIPLMICLVLLAGMLGCPGRTPSRSAAMAVAACAALLLKGGAILVIPWMLWSGLAGAGDRGRGLRLPLAAAALVAAAWAGGNVVSHGAPWPQSSALFKAYVPQNGFYYFLELPRLAGGWLVLALAGWGLYHLRRQTSGRVLAGWVVIFMLGLSLAAEKLDRYALMFLPAVWILAGAGVDRAAGLLRRRGMELFVPVSFLFLLVMRLPDLGAVLEEDRKFFRGYDQAGAVVRVLTERYPGALVIASCPDNIRYYAGLDLNEGEVLPLPADRAGLARLAAAHPGPMIVEVDNWGQTGMPRFNPDGTGLQAFRSMDFRPAGAFSHLRYHGPESSTYVAPAVWVFVRD